MKRFGIASSFFLTLLLLAGCTGDEAAPREVPDCSTPRATVAAYLEATRGFGADAHVGLFTGKAREALMKMKAAASYEILDEAVEGDQAVVKARFSNPPMQESEEMMFVLRKEGEAWKIARMGMPPMMIDFEDLEETMEKFGTSYQKDEAVVVET
ncbi:MAG: hypothetical protein ACYS47_18170, partial [Planctomycetota bacterium]